MHLVTPDTKKPLLQKDNKTLLCQETGVEYHRVNGVWHMLAADRRPMFDQFICEYETVRRAEGRQSADPDFYRQLPFVAADHPDHQMWQQRAASFLVFMKQILSPLESGSPTPLTILDIGAGNGWLSNQLGKRGHNMTAVDLTINDFDGLGVCQLYNTPITSIQADFDQLPLENNRFDLVIFNASFHYSTDTSNSLCESLRVLKNTGNLIIIDTPIYQNGATGRQMVAEREAAFKQQYGFPSNSLKSVNFLTYQQINRFTPPVQLIHTITPFRQKIRRLKTKVRGQREAAQFPILRISKQRGKRC